MSLVYIIHHDENIFDVEKDEGQQPQMQMPLTSRRFRRPRSLCYEQTKQHMIDLEDGRKLLTSSHISKHKTMGHAETPLNPPCAFLRKNQGIKWRRENLHVCVKGREIPPVPHFEHKGKSAKPTFKEHPVEAYQPHCPHPIYFRNHKHRANFVQINIERAKSSLAKHPPPRYVDTPTGTTHNLLNTGLIPQYICRKDFGKVPVYLKAHKKMLSLYQERCRELQAKQLKSPCHAEGDYSGVRPMTTDERADILAGLRTNLNELTKTYNSMSLYTDTIAKKLRKGKLETELRQLEQDILLMETSPVIYISDY